MESNVEKKKKKTLKNCFLFCKGQEYWEVRNPDFLT